jgi:hypothetical protein
MSDRDYEELFNEILVKTRDGRRKLKEELDRCFDEDPIRTSQILQEMWRVNEKAQEIETNRPGFMSLMTAIRSVKNAREEVIERIDKLMEEVRRGLAVKESLAGDQLDRLTALFCEHLENPNFKFHFQFVDDKELHHLTELRNLARNTELTEASMRSQPAAKFEPRQFQAEPRDFTAVLETAEFSAKEQTGSPFASVVSFDDGPRETGAPVGDWRSAPVTAVAQPQATLPGVAPDSMLASEDAVPLHEVETDIQPDDAASPYEVDVDVLKILSEETFRPRKDR